MFDGSAELCLCHLLRRSRRVGLPGSGPGCDLFSRYRLEVPTDDDASDPKVYESVRRSTVLMFLGELIEQAFNARVSYGHLITALTTARSTPPDLENPEAYAAFIVESRTRSSEIFLAVQGVLTASALISKLLWMSQPQRRAGCSCPLDPADEERFAQAKERCAALRKALKLKGEPPELSRRVRNAIEHYDDRIDRWIAADDGTVFATGIGPPESIGDGTYGFMRGFDPATMTAQMRGDSISLPDVMAAIDDLAQRAAGWLEENTAWRPRPGDLPSSSG